MCVILFLTVVYSHPLFKDAIEKLNSQQSNAATLDAIRASGGRLNELSIPEMLEYLDRIGYNVRFAHPSLRHNKT